MGSILSSAIYFLYHGNKNRKAPGGRFWVDQNLVKGGRVSIPNLAGYILYCLLYFVTQNMIFLTLWFSNLAQVNVGVICIIWSLTPLLVAIADYLIFKQKL